MSDSQWGVILLVLFGLFYWLGIFSTIRAIMAFIGTILLATNGFVGHALNVSATWAAHLGGTATGWAFGVALPAVAAIIAGVIFIHDLSPKKTAGKRTGFAGIALAALIVAGVTGISALNHVGSDVVHGVDNARQIAK
jgi:hypothetical protein